MTQASERESVPEPPRKPLTDLEKIEILHREAMRVLHLIEPRASVDGDMADVVMRILFEVLEVWKEASGKLQEIGTRRGWRLELRQPTFARVGIPTQVAAGVHLVFYKWMFRAFFPALRVDAGEDPEEIQTKWRAVTVIPDAWPFNVGDIRNELKCEFDVVRALLQPTAMERRRRNSEPEADMPIPQKQTGNGHPISWPWFILGCVFVLFGLTLAGWAFALGEISSGRRFVLLFIFPLVSGFACASFTGALRVTGPLKSLTVVATGGFGVWLLSYLLLERIPIGQTSSPADPAALAKPDGTGASPVAAPAAGTRAAEMTIKEGAQLGVVTEDMNQQSPTLNASVYDLNNPQGGVLWTFNPPPNNAINVSPTLMRGEYELTVTMTQNPRGTADVLSYLSTGGGNSEQKTSVKHLNAATPSVSWIVRVEPR